MGKDRINAKELVKEFLFLREKFPDEPKHLHLFTNFLRSFLRGKVAHGVPPTAEIMTHERPIIHSLMEKSMESLLYTLTSNPMNIEVARERLDTFVNKK
ncbi:hypothetical protein [Aneurinibacillus tyrosinisolvens]|uniref:hypothetical protein n=1 Tax=Aneurinibacillus tyrosinisolvens TaxID=1443435 RepID=UPI00063F8158|nr:hypothetical protein [Aneurinibacillus tyrosinisolvens]